MGYTTEFTGKFNLNKPLTVAQLNYLKAFAETRRMARNEHVTETMKDDARKAVALPVGMEGQYFVGSDGEDFGQAHTPDITEYNSPPEGQPGLWCKWAPSEDGTAIEWNGAEKFYSYIEWLEYIINHFLKPWGLALNGEVEYQGEESDDFGKIIVSENVVARKIGRKAYD